MMNGSLLGFFLVVIFCYLEGADGFKLMPSRSAQMIPKSQYLEERGSLGGILRSSRPSTPSSLQQSSNDDTTKSGGIEPKYLGALGVFVFAALYDFFITHGGQPYLAHPPSL